MVVKRLLLICEKTIFGSISSWEVYFFLIQNRTRNHGLHKIITNVLILSQPAGGVSQISFGGEECASPKKPVTIPEVAKQKELSGTVETTDDATARRCFSNAKAKELVGSNIFGPAPVEPKKHNRSLEMREEIKAAGSEAAQPRSVHTSVKVSNVSWKTGLLHEDFNRTG